MFETQQARHMEWRRKCRQMGEVAAECLRTIGVAAALRDGNGIRGVRAGCYTVGDLLLLRHAIEIPPQPHAAKRFAELEPDVIPWSREERGGIAALGAR